MKRLIWLAPLFLSVAWITVEGCRTIATPTFPLPPTSTPTITFTITNTPVGPANTATNSPTNSPSSTPTNTPPPGVPTNTPTNSPTNSPTNTPVVATNTFTPTFTCTSTTTRTIIADFESNNATILANQCRNGSLYDYINTGFGSGIWPNGAVTLSTPGQTGVGTDYAFRITGNLAPSNAGNGYAGYGGAGLNFLAPPTNLYDVTAGGTNTGYNFYAKMGAGAGLSIVRAVIKDAPVTCNCVGPHNVPITLTTGWIKYTVTFAQLTASSNSYGGPTTFTPTQSQSMEWQMVADAASTITFDMWIDDVNFQ